MPGTLYVIAAPIGNSEDITARAVRILRDTTLIAAEDTRETGKLLQALGLTDRREKKIISNHKFNETARLTQFITALEAGQDVALVSDAGTPAISDPGYRLVMAAAQRGIPVTSICGPCAVTAALSISGFPGEPFVFLGFLPKTKPETAFLGLTVPVVIFYESPYRILDVMKRLETQYADAQICLCNDLTKRYERIYRGTPEQVRTALEQNPNHTKGEYTCVCYFHDSNAEIKPAAASSNAWQPTQPAHLVDVMLTHNCDLKEAIRILSHQYGRKKEWYAASLRLKTMFGEIQHDKSVFKPEKSNVNCENK